MNKPLLGKKIAVLVANGFSERDLTHTQKALSGSGANVRIVSMDHGLVNSWTSEGWGLHFAADQVLSQALSADFDILVIPGGHRSIEKLELTAHTRRFINGFVDTGKKVVFFGDALSLLAFAGRGEGMIVAGPESCKAELEEAGAQFSDADYVIDKEVLSGPCTKEVRAFFVDKVEKFLTDTLDDDSPTSTTEDKVLEPVAA